MTPKITVLMAVYNGEAYLKECIESVLGQTYKDYEFLIIDDGSTDKTADIIRFYKDSRMRLIQNSRNRSQVASLNIGLDEARGEYVARIDADDVMLPHRLEKQIKFLERRTDLALCGSYGETINERGEHIVNTKLPVRNEEVIATVLFGGFITIHSAFMFRKKPIMDVGKYKVAFSFTEDYRLVVDLLLNGYRINNIPETLIKYRFHDDRISVKDSKPQRARGIAVVRDFFDNFTKNFSGEDKNLLFNFLINAESLKEDYWDKPPAKDELMKILNLSGEILANMSAYFKFGVKENYFVRRIFYNKVLNFSYQASFIKKELSAELYKECLRNSRFILNRPKLYVYPLVFAFSRSNRK